MRRDLFSSNDAGGVYLLDGPLLDRLAAEKLEAEAETVRAEGWRWVEVQAEPDHDARSRFQRRPAEPVPLSDEDDPSGTA